jgi:hypothetical protein
MENSIPRAGGMRDHGGVHLLILRGLLDQFLSE